MIFKLESLSGDTDRFPSTSYIEDGVRYIAIATPEDLAGLANVCDIIVATPKSRHGVTMPTIIVYDQYE